MADLTDVRESVRERYANAAKAAAKEAALKAIAGAPVPLLMNMRGPC